MYRDLCAHTRLCVYACVRIAARASQFMCGKVVHFDTKRMHS